MAVCLDTDGIGGIRSACVCAGNTAQDVDTKNKEKTTQLAGPHNAKMTASVLFLRNWCLSVLLAAELQNRW